ncbi:MAG: Coenzyme A disulfide reductase [Planctomycetes bacterium ADurb.Bin126]|nr:MAG: Coenzyme A disulfide reductase [Planctomycetes bacterium ADurb.Bin126]HOD83399.1 FAD-dependent oxidoreductase [Phycisphaerae bacterium]HQL74185.1 FAD-dependent oxidoreductase [Phycisphaerae bacterium]
MTQRKRIVIVGGVAGGASAAARARRLSEEAEILLFERGRNVSFANCGLPYHIGGVIPERKSLLVQTADGLRKRYNIDVRTRHEVLKIDRAARQVVVRDLESGQEFTQPYDALILSPGAEPIRPPIPMSGGRIMTLRSLEDMDRIKQVVDAANPGRAVVVGGGYIGLEMAEALRERKIETTLVELLPQVFAIADPEMVVPLHQQLRQNGVDLRLGQSVKAVRQGEGDRLNVELSTGESIEAGLVVLAVGVKPEAALAREAGLEIGSAGGIVVDEHMRTSDENIFAVGDVVESAHIVSGQRSLMPLAGPANRQGRIAADNAFGRPSAYRGGQGTAVCKVFDLTIGLTGLTEKQLVRAETPHEKIYVHPSSHAGYYPGAVPMSLKLLFDPKDGRILGAQAVGARGVDKRIDVIAVAQRAGLTVRDLTDLELSYAPPYGSAKDPVNYAGYVASNALDGDVLLAHYDQVANPRADQVLLDVRTAPEVKAGTIPGSLHIPVDELRGRLGELPRDKEILAFCQVGLRGYLACRILSQHGFRCRNLTGGYKTYLAFRDCQGPDRGTAAPLPKPPASFDGPRGGKPAPQNPAQASDGCCAGGASSSGAACCGGASATAQVVREIDARALQCPGPIMRLHDELENLRPGQAVRITTCDHGFAADVEAWCAATGNRLLDVARNNGTVSAAVARGLPQPSPVPHSTADAERHKSILVFNGDFDKAMASFIIANGAAAMGSKVTMFFTFWGLNVLRRREKVAVRKTLIERMFGWMMPRGADKLGLSKMNMGGMGLRMIKGIMRKKHVASLGELIDSARRAGVRMVACSMSMDLMGIKREELIDGIEEGGVAAYLGSAQEGHVNLVM